MSSATQTLLGLYQIGLNRDQNFFDHLTFPEGIDHDLVVTNILHQAGDFEVLYPDLKFMCDGCEMFSLKWKRTFEKWLEVMAEEYFPLDNYDRKEAWSDSYSESTSHSESLSTSESSSMSGHTSTSDSTSNSALTDNDISAFNANTLQNDTSAATNARTAGESSNDTKSFDHNNFIHNEKESDVKRSLGEHRGRVHGNIGVMTTQSIYLEQWDLQNLNLYDEIYRLFAREFLIPFSY